MKVDNLPSPEEYHSICGDLQEKTVASETFHSLSFFAQQICKWERKEFNLREM